MPKQILNIVSPFAFWNVFAQGIFQNSKFRILYQQQDKKKQASG